ncbi:MAG TPA: hypothetical protein VF686_10425, partial [Brevundimonas sp.]
MHTETSPTRSNWSPSQTEAILLVVMVAIVSDMPEPVPFWPDAFGQAPSVGTVLLIACVILAIARFGRRSDTRTDIAR